MYFDVFGSGACPSTLVRQNHCSSFYYVSIFQIYFLLNHFTHPHLENNLVLTLSYSIPDVLLRRFSLVWVRRMQIMAQSLPITKAQCKQPPGKQLSEIDCLEKAWQTRASTVYNKTWVKVTPQHRQVLRNTVNGWKDKSLTKPGKGGSLRTLKKMRR